MDADSDTAGRSRDDTRGIVDWTLTPAKWGAVGVLALAGCMGLAWSVIRGEARNAVRSANQAHAPAVENPRRDALAPEPTSPTNPPHASSTDSTSDIGAATIDPGGVSQLDDATDVRRPVVLADGAASEAPVPDGVPSPNPAPVQEPPPPPPDPSIAQRVNINTATEAELQALPGIGPSRARAIAEDRRLNGPFRSVDELDRVRGIGPGIIAGLKEFARVR